MNVLGHRLPGVAALLIAAASVLSAQQHDPASAPSALQHTVAIDIKGYGDAAARIDRGVRFDAPLFPGGDDLQAASKKNPVLAGALSLVLPGAGEVYAGSWLLGALFFGAEATGWYFRTQQYGRGDDQTALFESYADQHWSAVKYAEWLNANAKNFPGGENTKPIDINPDASLPPWQRVNWEQLHAVEMAVPVFSHRLPPHGDQQYFELIGKYNQYSYGWDDKTSGAYDDISARFREYSLMRGKANDYYNTAETILNLIILNHVLSVVDAAWAAARFNRNISLHSRVDARVLPDGMAELVPSATIRWRF